MTKRKPKGAYMLSGVAGVSAVRARRRNPDTERGEVEGTHD